MIDPPPSNSTVGPVVDLHSHFMPPDLPEMEVGGTGFPRLVPGDGGRGDIRLGEAVFRAVRQPCWDVAARLDEMDSLGIDAQVLSPVPVSLVHGADAGAAAAFIRAQNDRLAVASEQGGGRLPALGGVPLQDPDLAVAELERVVVDLGLAGVEIGTVVGECELDHPSLRPFFRAAAALGAPIFIHPVDGNGMARCGTPTLGFGIGMLTDTALAASALVFGGVLEECPGLRICLAHGGGLFPWSLPRLSLADRFGRDPAAIEERQRHLGHMVRSLYVDSLVFDEAHLPVLVHHFGADRIAYGTDYPFVPVDPAGPADLFGRASTSGCCSGEELNAMRGANSLAFLGLDLTTAGPPPVRSALTR